MAVERIINPNLTHLVLSHEEGRRGSILEGSSRSAKTWSSVDMLVYLASKVENNTLNIIKETYNSFKTTLYDDFNRRLPMYGISSPFADKQEVRQFKLFGNTINLLGADSDSTLHGVSCDYFYVNEALDVSKKVFDQTEQRCRKFWWCDYNPKYPDHWVYKMANRPDVSFLKTTFMDNPYLSDAERNKLLSYEPTHPDDRDKLELERRSHPSNIHNGTADKYMWCVYGLGLRSSPEGVVFQHVTWVDHFPKNIEKVWYGMDFGYTNSPTTIVKVGIHKNHVYLEKLHHGPTQDSNVLIPILKKILPAGAIVWADSADPGLIMDCRKAGLGIYAIGKFNGSIKYGISLLRKYKIHIIDAPEWRQEQSGYTYKEIHGIRLDEPIDDYNHLWDSARYAMMGNLK